MKRLMFGALAALAVVSTAQAKTLLWLPLDEEAPGTAITDGTKGHVTNAVNAATKVEASVIDGSATLVTGDKLPDYAPRYTKPHTGIQVYDPVSGAKRRNRAAMRFTTGPKDGAASYYGGTLRITGNDTKINPTGSFTVECFFATRMNTGVNLFAPLFGKRCDSLTSESWALYLIPSSGKLAVRLKTGTSSAKISEYSDSSKIPGNPVNDGNWHHVAYVYDKTQGKAIVYVDYAQRFEVPTTSGKTGENVAYYTGSEQEWKAALYIGGYPLITGNAYRKYNGNLDEFRISDEALDPSQFLRLQPEDDDELVHVRFDYIDVPGANENRWSIYGNYNDRLDIPVGLGRPVAAQYVVPDKAEKPAGIVRDNMYAEATENVSSYNVTTNGGNGAYAYVLNFSNYLTGQENAENRVATNVDYTIECFYKARDSRAFTGKQHIFKFGSRPICGALLRNNAEPRVMFTYNHTNVWGYAYSTEKTALDGWHHLAVVNDTTRHEMRFYFDGKLTASTNNLSNVISPNQNLLIGSTTDSSDRQYFDGWIDDFRVMKRALRPDEFLCTGDTRVSPEDPTVAFLNFEDNYAVSPYPTLMGEALGRKHGDGSAPVFVDRKRDWLVPAGGVTNTVASEKTLSCQDSVIELPGSPLFEQPAFTVEFMANISQFVKNGNLVRYVRQSDVSATPVWALYSPDQDGKLRLRVQTNRDGVSNSEYTDLWTLPKGWKNKWHHYALTVWEDAAAKKVYCELFFDGKSLGVYSEDGVLDYAVPKLADGRVMWGASAASNQVYAQIDALRFSRGVLTPDQFIAKAPIGMSLLIR